jgi:predicted GIY-YIG superfamily endonuclease
VPFFVYIQRLSDGRFYVGHTNAPVRRADEHRRGKGSRTTHVFGVDRILYTETFDRHDEAVRRERQLKGWSAAKKQALIDGNTGELKRLARCRSRADPSRAESRMP